MMNCVSVFVCVCVRLSVGFNIVLFVPKMTTGARSVSMQPGQGAPHEATGPPRTITARFSRDGNMKSITQSFR
uniref:Putative secreted protein n=1 Tax=Anopheles darlingi TaxID=43151 RepID=A0A2M4DI72_ANODA